MKHVFVIAAIAALTLWSSCVIRTEHKIDAHVTIDIRHKVEQEADDVLDFIEGESDSLPGLSETESGDSPARTWALIDLMCPVRTAYAAEMKSSSPVIKRIAERMKERHTELEKLRANGCVGENNRGYVEMRDPDVLKEEDDLKRGQQLVDDENDDRKALYKEVAGLNKDQNLTVAQVERIYAQKRLERGKPGYVFQLPPAGTDFTEFKKSAAGKKLGDKCVPDQWVTLPQN